MPFHKFMLIGLFVVLFALAALVSLVLWSGRGILENPHTADVSHTEWLTVANGEFEFRGAAYRTAETLSAGLLQLQPKPKLVSVRWVVDGGASPSNEVPSTLVQQARDALLEAHIATPNAVVGNEIFVSEPPTVSRAR